VRACVSERVWISKLICTFASAGSQCTLPSLLPPFTTLLWLSSCCLLSCCALWPSHAQSPCWDQGTTFQTFSHPTLPHPLQQLLGKHSQQPQQTPTCPTHVAIRETRPAPSSPILLAFPLFLSFLGKTAVPPALFDCPSFATCTPQREKHSSYFVWSAQIPCDG